MIADVRAREARVSDARRVVLFTVAIGANATLLFSVEPMFAKLALPLLGGAPSVWNTALVFYQAMLLLGYGYAHVSTRWWSPRTQLIVHGALFASSLIVLPLQLRLTGDPPAGARAIPWLIALLAVSLGLPFVALSAGAPLLQRWFAASTNDDDDPYFLYAASNAGSLGALLAYPLVIEPNLTLGDQRRWWSAGYVIVMLLVLSCARFAARHPGRPVKSAPGELADRSPSRVARARWVLYAAVPSSLLLGVTAYVTTDVAAIPLLWVVPLAIYLLTFVLAFSRRRIIRHEWMVWAEPFFLIMVAILAYWHATLPGLLPLPLHFGLLFVVSMVCHVELASQRPSAQHLTEFFLWTSVGGLLGGVFNALIAPLLFSGIAEYPIALVLAAALRPIAFRTGDASSHLAYALDLAIPAMLAGMLLVLAGHDDPLGGNLLTYSAGAAVLASLVLLGSADRPLRFSASLGVVFLVSAYSSHDAEEITVRSARSYFGAYHVREFPALATRELVHGTTVHGAQSLVAAHRLQPRTYYGVGGPIGDVFALTPAAVATTRRVGLVGLGVGSLSCYGRTGERWTYFEIDPLVVQLARDSTLFTFLRDCPPRVEMREGDARLLLRTVPDAAFDILVLDAFSSDAIPVHLLTREAFALYMRILASHGVLAVHVSNQHMDLEPIVASVARDLHLFARVRRDVRIDAARASLGESASVWVVLSRNAGDVGNLAADPRWTTLRAGGDLWTDDFSNVLHALVWR